LKSKKLLLKAYQNSHRYDFFSGDAGILYVTSILYYYYPDNQIKSLANYLAKRLIDSFFRIKNVYVWSRFNIDKQDESYNLGAAHGSIGIAFSLTIFSEIFGSEKAKRIGKETFKSLYRYGTDDNKTCLLQNLGYINKKTSNTSWCHGVGGFLWSVLQCKSLQKDLNQEISWAIQLFRQTYAVSNSSYCHGLAGKLETWRILKNYPGYFNEANNYVLSTSRILSTITQNYQGNEIWLCDNFRVVSPDFWVGYLAPSSALALYLMNSRSSILSLNW
jgi:lantibiotic modifying enzyme